MMLEVGELLKSIGYIVRYYRIRKKMSQRKLAELAGLSFRHYQYIEKGELNSTIETYFKISNVLDVQPEVLFQNLELKTFQRLHCKSQVNPIDIGFQKYTPIVRNFVEHRSLDAVLRLIKNLEMENPPKNVRLHHFVRGKLTTRSRQQNGRILSSKLSLDHYLGDIRKSIQIASVLDHLPDENWLSFVHSSSDYQGQFIFTKTIERGCGGIELYLGGD